ncbi:MAG: DUF2891 domain-containing protein, partial [Alphaproteobacteria bacterium]|nr:DUF2891 domain-containing protein [Alphaproteobacteria bacterium]
MSKPSPLEPALASRLARIALGHVAREYPNALVQFIAGPQELGTPRELHPVFYGSFDWHSCVHSHWLLARLLRESPHLPEGGAIIAHFDAAFTPDKIAGERAYLARPTSRGFERPYGWAWLLKLDEELARHETPHARRWAAALAPLAADFVARFEAFLPKADYPVRAGVHSNTAFALALALDHARAHRADAFAALIETKARDWYGADADCQAWEPSGDDFLSPALVEAELMRRVLTGEAYAAWLSRFLPRIAQGQPETLFSPARVSDPGD